MIEMEVNATTMEAAELVVDNAINLKDISKKANAMMTGYRLVIDQVINFQDNPKNA